MPEVVIVGAGISGLALAYRLGQLLPAARITVLEERDRPGGAVWTERLQGFQVERGPNAFRDTKASTLALCKDIGLERWLVPASESSSRNRFIFLDHKLRLLPRGLVPFLRSDILGWRGKAAIMTEPFRRRKKDGADESVDAFARRRFGREAAEVLIDAIVTGIYAGDPALLSAKATFSRLVALEEQYGSVVYGFLRSARQLRRERTEGTRAPSPTSMWSFREGLRLLIETLVAKLSAPPVFGVTVRRIVREQKDRAGSQAWTIYGPGNDRWPAEVVVLTCPTYRQAEMLADLDADLAKMVGEISYNRVAVVALGFKQVDVPGRLDGFGYISPENTRRDLLGVQWCSSIFPDRSPAGTILLRAMCGGWNRPDILDWSDDRLLQTVRAELRMAMNIQAAPVFHSIIRWDKAIPQYQIGHLDRVAQIQSRLGGHPGLYLGGNGYHGVAVNDCTEQAQILAGRVRRHLSERLFDSY